MFPDHVNILRNMKTITRILSLAALTTIFLAFPAKARENVPVRVAAPTGLGTYTEKPVTKVLDADISRR